jgi:dihydrolipoamide dehydrogenase
MSIQECDYDVIVIGAGPAGYVAAIRAAQLGLKTACVDNWSNRKGQSSLGGTYINAGCIPSIALLESTKLYHLLNHDINTHGIQVKDVAIDIPRMITRKDEITARLSAQISDIFKHNQIECIHADGRLLDQNRVEATHIDQTKQTIISAKNIILATGSSPAELPCAPIDKELIINSNDALNLDAIPKKMGIIGAGIIGFELAIIWSKLGSEITLLDAQECFLYSADQQIADEAYRLYTQQGLDIRLGARVISTTKENNAVTVEYQDKDGTHILQLDKLIVSTGRQPNTEHISAPEAELLLDEEGFIHVDEFCNTSLPGVYAIGDVTQSGPMLAHKGLEEGVFVAERIAGQHNQINYDIIPSVIYTDPEIAWVGQTEQALKAVGEKIKVGIFPIGATGRAQAIGKTDGLLKIITHADTDQILGVHIIGHNASELIAEAVLAMEFSASSEDLARTIHAHPTISEAMQEAALALDTRSLHLPPKP